MKKGGELIFLILGFCWGLGNEEKLEKATFHGSWQDSTQYGEGQLVVTIRKLEPEVLYAVFTGTYQGRTHIYEARLRPQKPSKNSVWIGMDTRHQCQFTLSINGEKITGTYTIYETKGKLTLSKVKMDQGDE